jgi:UDP-glucose 4-epimerase|tara:strand:+ start:475 stop:1389 length:915 start_codon:yes stop_codon:yes gene_type:complete
MVLITGGSGYLGGRIAVHLERLGYQVRIGKSVENDSNGFPIDLTDDHSINIACEGVSSIIHLAAMNAQSCDNNPEKALLINGLGTLKLLKSAKKNKVSKFLYFSTAHVYRSPLIGKISEELLPRPLHPYSITHRVAEDYVIGDVYQQRLSASVFRLTNAVGSPITPQINCWTLVVNDFCRQVVTSNSIKVYSNKFLQRDFIPISSICSVVSSSLDSNVLDGEIVNLSSGVAITLQSLAIMIADRSEVVLGFKPRISFLGSSTEVGTSELIISNSKLSNLGFKVDSNLSDEIDQLLLNCNKWFSE